MKTLKIAVVDDDQVFQFIINRSFTNLHQNSKVLNFANCADFFNFFKRNISDPTLLPDIVLLDVNTPFMSGWQFLQRYEEIESSIIKRPDIYLISSSIDPLDIEEAGNYASVSAFYSKPLPSDVLLEMLQKAMVNQD